MYGNRYGRPTVVSNIVVSKCECISLAMTVTLNGNVRLCNVCYGERRGRPMIAISPVLVNTMYNKHFFVVSKCECISLANTVTL